MNPDPASGRASGLVSFFFQGLQNIQLKFSIYDYVNLKLSLMYNAKTLYFLN